MRYHIYWQDKILLKDLDEEEFKNIWEKMHWVYNNELNYVEAALLASLPKAPSRYNPYKNINLAKFRRNLVLNNLFDKLLLMDYYYQYFF